MTAVTEEIFIRGLDVFGHHGVYAMERENGQNFKVSMTCEVAMDRPAATDDIEDTVNYGVLCFYIRDFFHKKAYRLLETAASKLCESLFLDFPSIRSISLEIGKPDAPIQMDFENVGVHVKRRWNKAALSLGSNMGDKKEFLIQGIRELKSIAQIRNVCESSIYLTTPYGFEEQETFLNMAVVLETFLSPQELLDKIHDIEQAAGRKREIHWGPRTLDLDILLYEDLIISERSLTIPHMDMCNRLFVLQPLAQIAPQMVHPLYRKRIAELLVEKRKQNDGLTQGKENVVVYDS